jgi:hypothetical protein
MFLDTEKNLLKKNWRGYHTPTNTSYISNSKQIDQISIKKTINILNQPMWKVSFPLKSSFMNYATFFEKEYEAKEYIKKIVDNYI